MLPAWWMAAGKSGGIGARPLDRSARWNSPTEESKRNWDSACVSKSEPEWSSRMGAVEWMYCQPMRACVQKGEAG